MNIFALDEDPWLAAKYHVDSHVVKMPVESAQMLCTALRLTMTDRQVLLTEKKLGRVLYRQTHPNHPSNIWVRESLSNWEWLRRLGLALLVEHHYRYGLKRVDIYNLIKNLPRPELTDLGRTPFTLAMPSWIKDAGLDPVVSYQVFYCNEKHHLFRWKGRPIPSWIPRAAMSESVAMKSAFGANVENRVFGYNRKSLWMSSE